VVLARESRREAETLTALIAARQRASLNVIPVKPDAAIDAVKLPKFLSHQFSAQFNETASGVGLPMDEVVYVLESDDDKPYLRYRLTMTVKTRYLDVRKFIAALSSDMPHVSLDTIQCGRESAAALPLSCQLAFSAFFAKG
jgi:hypothetical protein